jgi:hypothetical protein
MHLFCARAEVVTLEELANSIRTYKNNYAFSLQQLQDIGAKLLEANSH